MSISSMNLPANWESPRLDEVADVIDSLHKTPKYSTDGFRMVRVTDVRGGFLDLSNAFFVAEEVFKEFSKRHKPQQGDIVFSRVGSYGNASYVKADEPFCLGQNTAVIIPKINSRFLHQCLESKVVKRQIEESAVGSTQKTISLKSINALRIPLPPETERDAIASILGALDDKIELNRRMNATLESLARAIFKSWFVDFDPVKINAGQMPASSAIPTTHDPKVLDLFPSTFQDSELGPIPAGWEVGPVLEQADLLSGGTPKTKVDEYWHGGIPWASAKDVSQCGEAFLIQTEKTISALGLEKSSTKMIDKYSTVVVSRGATTGRLTMFGDDIAMNQTCYALRSKNETPFFLYCHARNFIERLVDSAHGSVFDTITTSTFKITDVMLPTKSVAEEYDRVVEPIFSRILSNLLESEMLGRNRDMLLPQLLSGELPVPAALTATEEALA